MKTSGWFLALAIVFASPAAAQLGTMQFDHATGQFTITFPAPLGELSCDGTYGDDLVTATARMVATPSEYFTVGASRDSVGVWSVIVSYGAYGDLRYRLSPGAVRTFESTTLPLSGCGIPPAE